MRAEKIDIDWHPGLSIYASEKFLKSVGNDYGWLGGFNYKGKLRCILPYTIIKKAIFRLVRFRVETIPVNGALSVDEEKAFLNSAVDYFRSIGAGLIIPATTNTIFRTFPDGAVAAPYGTYFIDLGQPEEMLWKNLHSKHRNVIRKAMKEDVEIRCGMEYADIAHKMISETLKRSKLKFMGLEAFNAFLVSLEKNVKIFTAYHDGIVQGCAVIPFSSFSAYYLYGGSASKTITGANNLLQWKAIQKFQEMGVKYYDFVGVRINPDKNSKQAGLTMFKKRFGSRLKQGYMWKCSINPLQYASYSFAARIVKGGDIVDAEKHKFEKV